MSMSQQHVEVEAVGAYRATPEASALASLFGSNAPLSGGSMPGSQDTTIFAQAKTPQGIRLAVNLKVPLSHVTDPSIALQVIDQLWQECRQAVQQQAQQTAQQAQRAGYAGQFGNQSPSRS